MRPSSSGAAKEHRTVSRVITILELAAARRSGVRLAELAANLDAPRSSVHGLVKGLVATGYLRDDEAGYTIGPAISALLTVAPPTIADAARPAMRALHDQFNETVMLAALVGDSVVYTETIDSTQPIRYFAPLRTRRPLYPTSTGKCILAFATERFRENYLKSHVLDLDERERIRRELRNVALAGVSINRGETLPDISGVGVPIMDKGRVAAVLAVAGPTTRLGDLVADVAEAAKAAAQEVSERLAMHR